MKGDFFVLTANTHSDIVSLCNTKWSNPHCSTCWFVPCTFSHISHDPSDSCSKFIILFLYLTVWWNSWQVLLFHLCWHKILVISSLFKTFTTILCSKLCVQEGWVFGLTFMCNWSALTANFSLCCLALLILSGKPEHKCGESSFILMSQVLDLLKSEYWNGLELGTFKGLRIRSACGADLGWGNEFFPPDPVLVWHSSFSFLFFYFLKSLLFLQSYFCWISHAVWQEFYANVSS